MDGDAEVMAVGPVLPAAMIEEVGLGAEEASFAEREFEEPAAFAALHGDVAPRGTGGRRAGGVGLDDFTTEGGAASEINDKVKKTPFIVDTDVGCKAIVDAIERERTEAFVPSWPWAPLGFLMKRLPLSVVARLT